MNEYFKSKIITKEQKELDRIAKMLIRRDLELSEVREKREEDIRVLARKAEELEKTKKALTNMLEDAEEARGQIEKEKIKTMAIINNFTDGLLFFDNNNHLSLINPEAESFFNVKSEQVLNLHISELKTFDLVRSLIFLLGENMKKVSREELDVKENAVLEVSTIPIMKGEKEKEGTLIILHDITREKLIANLKTEFISIAAHQLRTPLSSVKWILKMILDGDMGSLNLKQMEFIRKGYTANERMIALVNDLLDVSRIEEGRFGFEFLEQDFSQFVKEVIVLFKEQAEVGNIDLELKIEESPVMMYFDANGLRMVFNNLLDNAIRYTSAGGKVEVSVEKKEDIIKVSIKDTGVGVPEIQKNRIFTKFFRADNVIRMQTEGTGLGLYLSKNIIEAHGGKMWFESEEKKGSSFYFTVPVYLKKDLSKT